MMRVDLVPSVVVRFHGLDCSSAFSTLSDAMWLVLLDYARKAAMVTAELAGIAMAWQGVKLALCGSAEAMSLTFIAGATFWSTEALAITYAGKRSALIKRRLQAGGFEKEKIIDLTSPVVSPSPQKLAPIAPRLPRLNTTPSIAVISKETTSSMEEKVEKAQSQKTSPSTKTQPQQQQNPVAPSLPPLRRRILNQLHMTPPGVNRVSTDRRRRGDQSLFQSKVRVGKAWLDPVAARRGRMEGKRNHVDMYMVRVDCGREDDKHMNPVVMWDVTSNYDEFRKLEKDLRVEVKGLKLRNVHVPHLSSGAILFVQEGLNDDVLSARRLRLQAFIDAIVSDAVLSDLTATRKFFQVC